MPHGFGRYQAADYDELIDHPVEMVDFAARGVRRWRRAARDRDHRPAPTIDSSALARDLAQHLPVAGRPLRRRAEPPAVRSLPVPGHRRGRRLWRPRAPIEHEPAVSTRRASGAPGAATSTDGYLHCRAREPRIFPQLEREADQAGGVHAVRPRARELHAAAVGVRGHHVVLRRPGARAQRRHRRRRSISSCCGRAITRCCARRAGTGRASPTRASMRGSSSTGPDENSPERGRQLLREGIARRAGARPHVARSDGRTSLDDVMRALWQRHGRTGVGVPEDAIRSIVGESSASVDMRPFFARYVHGTGRSAARRFTRSVRRRLASARRGAAGDRGGKLVERGRRPAGSARELPGSDAAARFHRIAGGTRGTAPRAMLLRRDRWRRARDRTRLVDALATRPARRASGFSVHAFRARRALRRRRRARKRAASTRVPSGAEARCTGRSRGGFSRRGCTADLGRLCMRHPGPVGRFFTPARGDRR